MAPKRNATVPTRLPVVEVQPLQTEMEENITLAKAFGSKKSVKKAPKESASKDPAQSSKPTKKTIAKRAVQKDEGSRDAPKEKVRKQPARNLIDELEEGDPEGETEPVAFEATFDSGNSPNAGDEPEATGEREERSGETEELNEEAEEEEADMQETEENDEEEEAAQPVDQSDPRDGVTAG